MMQSTIAISTYVTSSVAVASNALIDRQSQVDTKAVPPRSIWVHPHEDEQYLMEHPEVREKVRGRRDDAPPIYAPPSSVPPPQAASSSNPRDAYQGQGSMSPQQHRSFLSKVKDSVVGLKDERDNSMRAVVRPFDLWPHTKVVVC